MLFAFTSESSTVALEENDDEFGFTEGSSDSPLLRSQGSGFLVDNE